MSSTEIELNCPKTIEELEVVKNDTDENFSNPISGARTEKKLPRGKEHFQFYSLATTNGQKVGIILEELGIPYDAHVINIGFEDQFGSGFVNVNPNSKIPAAIDYDGPGGKPIHLWESGAIVLYLAHKHAKFIPKDKAAEQEALQWIIWQQSSLGPIAGNFWHFFSFASLGNEARNYGVAKYGLELKRLLDVFDKHLKGKTWVVGSEYSIADIVLFTWTRGIIRGAENDAGVNSSDFLGAKNYLNVVAWVDRVQARPAVQRGITVCSFDGVAKPWVEKEQKKSKQCDE